MEATSFFAESLAFFVTQTKCKPKRDKSKRNIKKSMAFNEKYAESVVYTFSFILASSFILNRFPRNIYKSIYK